MAVIKKGLALLLSFSLISNGSVLASSVKELSRQFPATRAMVLPAEWGHFTTRATQSSKYPHVIYIQDAHANPEAQENIKNALLYLNERYGLKRVFVEGAAYPVLLDPKNFFAGKDPQSDRAAAQRLMKQGELSGVDLAILSRTGELQGLGIENIPAYRANIESFRKVASHRTDSEAYLRDLSKRFDRLASRKMNPGLLKVLRLASRLDSSRNFVLRDVGEFCQFAKRYLGLNLALAQNQDEFPNLVRLQKTTEIEKEINLEKAKGEAKAITAFLNRSKIDLELVDAFTRVFDTDPPERAFNPRFILEKVYDAAYPAGFRFESYPHFSLLAARAILTSEIDAPELFKEYEALTERMLRELAKTDAEIEIVRLFEGILLLEKLFKLHWAHDDFEKARERFREILPSNIEKTLVRLGDDRASELAGPDDLALEAMRFYELAQKREGLMFESMRTQLSGDKRGIVALVSGGFHEAGFRAFARAHGLSYSIFMPKAGMDDSGNYERLMLGRQFSAQNSYLALWDRFQPPEVQEQMQMGRAASLGSYRGRDPYRNLKPEEFIPTLKSLLKKSDDAGREATRLAALTRKASDTATKAMEDRRPREEQGRLIGEADALEQQARLASLEEEARLSELNNFVRQINLRWTVDQVNNLITQFELTDDLRILPDAFYLLLFKKILLEGHPDFVLRPKLKIEDLIQKLSRFEELHDKIEPNIAVLAVAFLRNLEAAAAGRASARLRRAQEEALVEEAPSEDGLVPVREPAESKKKLRERDILRLIAKVIKYCHYKDPNKLSEAEGDLRESVGLLAPENNDGIRTRGDALYHLALCAIEFRELFMEVRNSGEKTRFCLLMRGMSSRDRLGIYNRLTGALTHYQHLLFLHFGEVQDNNGGPLRTKSGKRRDPTIKEKVVLNKITTLRAISDEIAKFRKFLNRSDAALRGRDSTSRSSAQSLGAGSLEVARLTFGIYGPGASRAARTLEKRVIAAKAFQAFNTDLAPLLEVLKLTADEEPMAIVADVASLPTSADEASSLVAGLVKGDLVILVWAVGGQRVVEKPRRLVQLAKVVRLFLDKIRVKDIRVDRAEVKNLNDLTERFQRGIVVSDIQCPFTLGDWRLDHDSFALKNNLLAEKGVSSAQVAKLLRVVASVRDPDRRTQAYRALQLDPDEQPGKWVAGERFLAFIHEVYSKHLAEQASEQSA